MADITVTCDACGRAITVSEFVLPGSVRCPGCGLALSGPKDHDAEKSRPQLRTKPTLSLAQEVNASRKPPLDGEGQRSGKRRAEGRQGRPHAEEPVLPEHLQAEARQARQDSARRKKRAARARGQRPIIAWTLFLCVGVTTGILKYGGFFPSLFSQVRDYGFFGAFILYVILAVKAFEDSAFTGVLAIIFPPYGLYYLFAMSDDFFLRAIVAGTLIGFGEDTAYSTRDHLAQAYHKTYNWISAQGEPDFMQRLEDQGR